MDQRRAGMLVLVAALLSVAAIALVGQAIRPLPGKALALPLGGAPSVGDCALAPSPAAFPYPVAKAGQYRVPNVAPLAPCVGTRFGEVFEVVDALTKSDQQASMCLRLDDYLEMYTDPSGIFVHSYSVSTTLVGPNDRQFASGQRWVACVVIAGHQGQFDRPVKQSWSAMPSAFATCWADAGPTQGVPDIACDSPHRMELLGVMFNFSPDLTQSGLDARCKEWARTVTNMADVTAGDQLLIRAVMEASPKGQLVPALAGGDGASDRESDGFYTVFSANCVAVPADENRVLIGPLTSLGNGPVPFG
ncbi:hypothetical protein EH165_00770 [Nakamurella antarctica]|uniref:Septum formation-related domain-containing protein n=1 Tax=Nakamurella antarctica TaxID=1902245 RepID=A0A3G8ZHT3_9ACTN|nr:septum formation family protein [Nakamurella antarctica]AZI56919.1 hypothetical protein EH165_00770 [Nakamurella antarctica]